MKPILQSRTTKCVAAAGGASAALLTLLELLQARFPEQDWLNNPAFLTASLWVINTILLPYLSRLLARTTKP